MEQTDNARRRKEILNELSPKAIPMNAAWRRLEAIGEVPDYDPKDAGEYYNDKEPI